MRERRSFSWSAFLPRYSPGVAATCCLPVEYQYWPSSGKTGVGKAVQARQAVCRERTILLQPADGGNQMNLGLAGKVVVVTGGAAGIGAAIVRALGEEGAVPIIFDRAAAGGDAYALDLGDPAACIAAVKAVATRHGRIDGLVNNAGVNDRAGLGGALEGALAAFRASLERNLVHYYTMMHLCLPHLRASRGAVVNVASKVALTGQGGTSGYAAAKGGQLGLTREWAAELAVEGIRVNAVLPAEVATPMYEQWLSGLPDPAARRAAITGAIPLGARMTKPEEIAASVVFLLSAQAAHITGQFHVVDGGYVHLDRALTAR